MTRKASVVWAAAVSSAALHAQCRAEQVAEVRTRLHALWLRWHREGGLDAVRAHRRGGPGKPSHLTPDQEAQVAAEAIQDVFATAQAVRDWIEAQFGVAYTRSSMYTLLPRLEIRLKAAPPHEDGHPGLNGSAKGGFRQRRPAVGLKAGLGLHGGGDAGRGRTPGDAATLRPRAEPGRAFLPGAAPGDRGPG